MAVGKGDLPELKSVKGLRLGVTSAGIKRVGRLDLVVLELAPQSSVAAMFTTNAFCAAPVRLAKQHIAVQPGSRYFIINTGNANAGTGEDGLQNALRCCEALAETSGVPVEAVLPFSTGVIGEPLPVDKIVQALPAALEALSEDAWPTAAQGIMTTDTRPKGACRQITLSGETVTITGIAKGAGMIKPNMATMLAYVATDARVEQTLLQTMLADAVNQSFNRITIDGDTSTNDACMLIATGQLARSVIDKDELQPLQDAITDVCIELAQGLVRDGEGASKFVTIDVSGAIDEAEGLRVAYTVAESPLVKTALFASDPNWGRILAAIGRAGVEKLDVNTVMVLLNGVLIAKNGARATGYTEEQGAAVMAQEEINIAIDLGRGNQHVRVWTTDLSHEYVRVNAEYRT